MNTAIINTAAIDTVRLQVLHTYQYHAHMSAMWLINIVRPKEVEANCGTDPSGITEP